MTPSLTHPIIPIRCRVLDAAGVVEVTDAVLAVMISGA
jgi:hypothetical protein